MSDNIKKPIRVLHVVGGMNRGGTETWLMHILRNTDREKFHMDFLVHTSERCAYDDEIRALGSKVIFCANPSRPLQYIRNLKRILKEHGPYDVVHSHVHHFSGLVLYAAHMAGIPIRIAHSHSNTLIRDKRSKFPRKTYLTLMKHLIRRHATCGLAASKLAAVALYGANWETDPRWRVLYCGIDLAPFRESICRAQVRTELGIPMDALVIGHIGRFEEPKNHSFLVDIAVEVLKRNTNVYFLLLGDGHLRNFIKNKVASLGLSDRFIFAGVRSDVPRILKGAVDIFLFPSLYEGLPLVLLEAQAAGLPCVISDAITTEVDVVKNLIKRVSLLEPPSKWAEILLKATRNGLPHNYALECISNSAFNIKISEANLRELYVRMVSGNALKPKVSVVMKS